MINEKSCGCIIINSDNKVLLVYEKGRDFWGFPKGHTEKDETEIETALREVKEEVGIDVKIDESIRYESKYSFDNINKTVVFYKAIPVNENVLMQESEIEEYRWCSYDEAIKIIKYDNLKSILKSVMKKSK